jgi:hypothetical protein
MDWLLVVALLAIQLGMSAQVKVGDNHRVMNSNAVLEVESTNKGFLLPRLALTSSTNSRPLTMHVAGMVVYNTATVGDVLPGFYYNNGSKWVSINKSSIADIEGLQDELDMKAEQTDLDATNALVVAKADKIYVDSQFTILQNNINAKANQTDLNTTNAIVATNTTNIATNTTAIAGVNTSLAGKANQTDLNATNAIVATKVDKTYVDAQDAALQNNINAKANQTDLNTTNANVATNTTNIATNTTAIAGINTSLAGKVNQADLDLTNTNVAANTTNIATNTTAIAGINTSLAGKANQTDLNATNANVATNTTNIATNTTAITGINTSLNGKANKAGDTFTGDIFIPNATGTTPGAAAVNKTYVDAAVAGATIADASETVKGKIMIADATDITTGTDNTKAVTIAKIKPLLDAKANLSGAVFTGVVTVPDMSTATSVTTVTNKGYVDAAITTLSLYQGGWDTAAALPGPGVAQNGWTYDVTATATLVTTPTNMCAGDLVFLKGDKMKFSGTCWTHVGRDFPLATTTQQGVVQLETVMTSASTTLVPTTKLVSDALNLKSNEVVSEEFPLTGPTTSFTLTAPAVATKVKVYVNGMLVNKAAYTVVGETVTYNPANNYTYPLANGDKVTIDYVKQ